MQPLIADVTVFQAITLAIALLGAVLGLINTWVGIDKNRLKLRVRPQHAIPLGAAPSNINFCISVTNLSAFAVTIDDVGVLYHGTKDRASFALRPIIIPDQGGWPRRLEPRTSLTVYGERPLPHHGKKVKVAYATTACGSFVKGGSNALDQIAQGKANF